MPVAASTARRSHTSGAARPHGRPTRRPTTRRNTRPNLFAVTNAENFYDYANQDPISGYDLDGTMMAEAGDAQCTVIGPSICTDSGYDPGGIKNPDAPGLDGTARGVEDFVAGIPPAPKAFLLATGSAIVGTGLLVTGVVTYGLCEAETGGILTLACHHGPGALVIAGVTMWIISYHQYRIVYQTGKAKRRQ